MKAAAFAAIVLVTAARELPAQTAQRVASGLTAPVFATSAPGDPARLFIAEQGSGSTATIKILDLATKTVLPTPFLTVTGVQTGGEQGLLGMAFAPDYATTGRFYVDFTGPGSGGFANTIHIREYTVSANPNIADAASARPILQVPHPQTNHNAGWIGFSPRTGDTGNLYITMGDGGNGNDSGPGHVEPNGNAQTATSRLGKMLRINVNTDDFPTDANKNYGIPLNNPFASSTLGAPEVFTLGLRNPFRAGFDRTTGNLFIGDVGQGSREEVDVQKADNPGGGENYGWRVREGFIQNPAYPSAPMPAGAVDPIDDYPQSVGRSVIGGFMYRGPSISSLAGKYVFGDYFGDNGLGDIFTLDYDGTTGSNFRTITSTLFPAGGLSGPAAFAEDAAGELYVVSQGTGEVYKIVPEPGSASLLLVTAAIFSRRRSRWIQRRN